MTFIVHASTPEDLRNELLEWLKAKHTDAKARASVKNQAPRVRFTWVTRAHVIEEAAAFIQSLKIEPKIPPATDPLSAPVYDLNNADD